MPLPLVLGLLVASVAVGFTAIYMALMVRSQLQGFWPWEIGRLRRDGTPATAVVLSRISRPSREAHKEYRELVLEVRPPPGAQPLRVKVVYLSRIFDEAETSEGAQVPVLVAAGSPARVFIDFEAMKRAREMQAAELQAQKERRQRELLGGGRS